MSLAKKGKILFTFVNRVKPFQRLRWKFSKLFFVVCCKTAHMLESPLVRDFLNRAAQMTGGRVAEISNLQSLAGSFGAPKETLTERQNVTLWDKWPLLVLFLGLLTTEWVLRRKSGLA